MKHICKIFFFAAVFCGFFGFAQETKPVSQQEPENAAVKADVEEAVFCTLEVKGMTCSSCEAGVERALMSVPGVVAAKANFDKGEAKVKYNPALVTPKDLLKAPVHHSQTLGIKQKEKAKVKEKKTS